MINHGLELSLSGCSHSFKKFFFSHMVKHIPFFQGLKSIGNIKDIDYFLMGEGETGF